ncbi:MAG: hypothetical protein ACNYNX_08035 [Leucobacter sp.]
MTKIAGLVDPDDYADFDAGWRDGVIRSTVNPAPLEVIEDIALLLESADIVESINPLE